MTANRIMQTHSYAYKHTHTLPGMHKRAATTNKSSTCCMYK